MALSPEQKRENRFNKILHEFKKVGIIKCINATAKVLQELVRLEDQVTHGHCTCVTCGKKGEWNCGFQGGHFIDRNRYSVSIVEDPCPNIHPQCVNCNSYESKSRMHPAYEGWMLMTYGDKKIRILKAMSKATHTYTKWNLVGIKLGFEERRTIARKAIRET